MEWQTRMIYDILAKNEDGLFTHEKCGWAIPRRNGKGEILVIRELYGLEQGEHILHTAHRADTSSSASVRLERVLKDKGYTEVLRPRSDRVYPKGYVYAKQSGKEHITLLDTGGTVEFRTRTSVGGLGQGFDVLVIDEAQEYTQDQESTLKYTVSDGKNPQILLCGTPPTSVSSGTVFEDLRKSVFSGKTNNTLWAEWSVPVESDVNDIELWYETNPSMGVVLTERKVKAEITNDELDFNIQRLGYWPSSKQNSVISAKDWDSIKCDALPRIQGKLFAAVCYSKEYENVALAIAVRTQDNKIMFEAIDCQSKRNGDDWILNFLSKADIESVAIDGANCHILAEEMARERIKAPVLVKPQDLADASMKFEKDLFSGDICHMDQPSLRAVFTNTEKRNVGAYGWTYQCIIKDLDSALAKACVLAFWLCKEVKPKKKQKVSY